MNILKGCEFLESINLYMNNIEEIEPKAFCGLSTLKQLNISYNELTAISGDLFHELKKLEFLNLCNNQLSSMDLNQFKGLFDSLWKFKMFNLLFKLEAL